MKYESMTIRKAVQMMDEKATSSAHSEALLMSPSQRAQDGFCVGNYEVEITVFPDNGAPKSEKFMLSVAPEWGGTSLT